MNLIGITLDCFIIDSMLKDQFGVGANDHQHVVKVMSNPAGKPPTASIFWAWENCFSRVLRSVTFSAKPRNASTSPLLSRTGIAVLRTVMVRPSLCFHSISTCSACPHLEHHGL